MLTDLLPIELYHLDFFHVRLPCNYLNFKYEMDSTCDDDEAIKKLKFFFYFCRVSIAADA